MLLLNVKFSIFQNVPKIDHEFRVMRLAAVLDFKHKLQEIDVVEVDGLVEETHWQIIKDDELNNLLKCLQAAFLKEIHILLYQEASHHRFV